MLLAIGVEICFHRAPVPHASTPHLSRATVSGLHPGIRLADGAPWGELESTSFALERPDELSPENDPVTKPIWNFPGANLEKLSSILQATGLSDDDRKLLLDSANCRVTAVGCTIQPPVQLVLNLPAPIRQKLYGELARDPANFDQRFPFLYRMGRFDEWFFESGLPSEKIDLIERLSYTNGNSLCFADIESFRSISSSNENYLLIKALSRVSTELVRVRVQPGTVPGLLQYWGRGRRDLLKPLLESLARTSDPRVGVGFLLPSFARLRVFTYPDPLKDSNASREDCYWSSMNFFSESPDPRFFDFAETVRTLRQDYITVEDRPAAFGDVILLQDAKGQSVHMCVYIAEDIIFTKNGAHYLQPWVLMRYSDVLAHYPDAVPSQTKLFRRRIWLAPGQSRADVQ